MVIIKVKDYGTIKVELQYGVTQNTAANFVELARKGFYNGKTFYMGRAISLMMYIIIKKLK